MAKGRSEFFRAQHGHDQVNEAAERDETNDDVFHGEKEDPVAARSARLVAEANVGCSQEKKSGRKGDENQIVHGAYRTAAPAIRLIKNRAVSIKKMLRPRMLISTGANQRVAGCRKMRRAQSHGCISRPAQFTGSRAERHSG
jgi:hypothetical protein